MTCHSSGRIVTVPVYVSWDAEMLPHNPNPNNSGAAPCTNSDTLPRLSGSLLLSLTCCSPPSLLCGRNSGRLWGRSRGTTNIVIPQVILTLGLGQSNVNLLCLYGYVELLPPP